MSTKTKKNTQLMFAQADIDSIAEFQQECEDEGLNITKAGLLRACLSIIKEVYANTDGVWILNELSKRKRVDRVKRPKKLKQPIPELANQ